MVAARTGEDGGAGQEAAVPCPTSARSDPRSAATPLGMCLNYCRQGVASSETWVSVWP